MDRPPDGLARAEPDLMELRQALIVQGPSMALQRAAQDEISRLDAEVARLQADRAELRQELAGFREMAVDALRVSLSAGRAQPQTESSPAPGVPSHRPV